MCNDVTWFWHVRQWLAPELPLCEDLYLKDAWMVRTWNYKQQIEKVWLHLRRTWDWIHKEIEISQGTMASIWATARKGGENLTRSLRSVPKNWLLISFPDIFSLLIHYSTDTMSLHISPNFLNSNISCIGIFPNWYLNRQALLMSLLSVFWTLASFIPAPTSRLKALSTLDIHLVYMALLPVRPHLNVHVFS